MAIWIRDPDTDPDPDPDPDPYRDTGRRALAKAYTVPVLLVVTCVRGTALIVFCLSACRIVCRITKKNLVEFSSNLQIR